MSVAVASDASLAAEIARRRTFAIISHPDAGKTTLTEKFLLYAGAVHEAGAVRSRKQAKATTSDWMELERQRGISVSSTVLHFSFGDWRFNLLDTPGHADFSEDTYRTLCAADAALMVLDAAKGLEPQTLKLFRVCRERGLPIITFVNKCDRPGLAPLGLLDQISMGIGVEPVPLTWPIADGADFAGIVDRRSGELVRFDRTVHGAHVGEEQRVNLADARPGPCPPDRWHDALDELALLDLEGRELDRDAFFAGHQTPVFFGSALANFGVRLLLERFAELAPTPAAQAVADLARGGAGEDLARGGAGADLARGGAGEDPARGGAGEHLARKAAARTRHTRPTDAAFSGQVFKVQANMDPRHRDRIAFIRVCSGRFTRGMTATHAGSGRRLQLKYAHQLFAAGRDTLDQAVAGDVVGITGIGDLQVGDTLYDGDPVRFPPLPAFAPERFATVRNRDTSRYKQFRRALKQLDEEGVVWVLQRPELGLQEPILAGVGQLQFDVAAYRMANEFGAEVDLQPALWQLARQVTREEADRLRDQRDTGIASDSRGRVLALFASEYALRWAKEDHPDVVFAELGINPASD